MCVSKKVRKIYRSVLDFTSRIQNEHRSYKRGQKAGHSKDEISERRVSSKEHKYEQCLEKQWSFFNNDYIRSDEKVQSLERDWGMSVGVGKLTRLKILNYKLLIKKICTSGITPDEMHFQYEDEWHLYTEQADVRISSSEGA